MGSYGFMEYGYRNMGIYGFVSLFQPEVIGGDRISIILAKSSSAINPIDG